MKGERVRHFSLFPHHLSKGAVLILLSSQAMYSKSSSGLRWNLSGTNFTIIDDGITRFARPYLIFVYRTEYSTSNGLSFPKHFMCNNAIWCFEIYQVNTSRYRR